MPKIIEYNGQKYEFVADSAVGSCARCIAMSDKIMCAALGAHCDDGHFISAKEEE